MAEKPMIFAAMNSVMKGIGYIPKDKKNLQQGYDFRGIDDIYNALYASLCENGIFILPTVLERKDVDCLTRSGTIMYKVVLRVKFTFYALDGSFVEATTDGEAMDMADKATNKSQSAAFKYAMLQAFSIPTKELIDADLTTPPDTVHKTTQQAPKSQTPPPPPPPVEKPKPKWIEISDEREFVKKGVINCPIKPTKHSVDKVMVNKEGFYTLLVGEGEKNAKGDYVEGCYISLETERVKAYVAKFKDAIIANGVTIDEIFN